MDGASQILDKPIRGFDEASSKILRGRLRQRAQRERHVRATRPPQVLKDAGFGAEVEGATYSTMSEGTVVYSDPVAGRCGARRRRSTPRSGTSPSPREPKSTPKPDKTPDKPKRPELPPKPTTTKSD